MESENVTEVVETADSASSEVVETAEVAEDVAIPQHAYQQLALSVGYDFGRMQYALDLKNRNPAPEVRLLQADADMVRGYIKPAGGTRDYDPIVNFKDVNLCKCSCGYSLPYKYSKGNKALLCAHQILMLIYADNGREIIASAPVIRRGGRTSGQTSAATTSPSTPGQYSFKSKISAAITKAITAMAEDVLEVINRGKIPFLLGPTGCGKTSCIDLIVGKLGFGYETIGGMESYADADIIGLHTTKGSIKGIIARAFERARNGEKVIIFIDEFLRFDARIQNLFMLALLPRSADTARSLGIDLDAPGYTEGGKVFITEAPVWGTEWAPADNIVWIFGANPWGARCDPAFVRRVQPMYVGYSEEVLKPLNVEMAEFIKTTWEMCTEGSLPLPVEYGMIAGMRNGTDTTIFTDYLPKLQLLDPGLRMTIAQMIPEFSTRQVNAAEAAAATN